MTHLLTLLHEAARGGFTLGRTVGRIGGASLEVVVRVLADSDRH